jgi:hypothetical protein
MVNISVRYLKNVDILEISFESGGINSTIYLSPARFAEMRDQVEVSLRGK